MAHPTQSLCTLRARRRRRPRNTRYRAPATAYPDRSLTGRTTPAFLAHKQSILLLRGEMDCFASLAMTPKHTFTPSRRYAPEALFSSAAQRGRGERRVPVAPAVSCALCIDRTHTSNNEYTGITRHSRTQWFYDLLRALPGDRALLPPSPADMLCLSPVGPTQLRKLDASVGASGPHHFAVR